MGSDLVFEQPALKSRHLAYISTDNGSNVSYASGTEDCIMQASYPTFPDPPSPMSALSETTAIVGLTPHEAIYWRGFRRSASLVGKCRNCTPQAFSYPFAGKRTHDLRQGLYVSERKTLAKLVFIYLGRSTSINSSKASRSSPFSPRRPTFRQCPKKSLPPGISRMSGFESLSREGPTPGKPRFCRGCATPLRVPKRIKSQPAAGEWRPGRRCVQYITSKIFALSEG